jgi:hypothetical protein
LNRSLSSRQTKKEKNHVKPVAVKQRLGISAIDIAAPLLITR